MNPRVSARPLCLSGQLGSNQRGDVQKHADGAAVSPNLGSTVADANASTATIIWSALTPGAGAVLLHPDPPTFGFSSLLEHFESVFLDFHLVKESILHLPKATNCTCGFTPELLTPYQIR